MTPYYFKKLRSLLLITSLFITSFATQAQMDFSTVASQSKTSDISETNDAILFIDQGDGFLENGQAEIEISPAIADLIDGDRIEDMVTVSIQLEGENNGVYVTNKNKDAFVITELLEGTSNTKFSYTIVVKDI